MLTKLKELEKKKRWGILAIIVVLAVGGFYAYKSFVTDAETASAEPAMQTATIRRGDLTLYASGTGTLIPAAEASFGFRSSGQLLSLSVDVGDSVNQGDLLGELDNTPQKIQLQQAERTLAEMTSPAAIATAEQALAQAELDVADAKEHLAYLISWAVLRSEEEVEAAKIALADAEQSGDEEAIADHQKRKPNKFSRAIGITTKIITRRRIIKSPRRAQHRHILPPQPNSIFSKDARLTRLRRQSWMKPKITLRLFRRAKYPKARLVRVS